MSPHIVKFNHFTDLIDPYPLGEIKVLPYLFPMINAVGERQIIACLPTYLKGEDVFGGCITVLLARGNVVMEHASQLEKGLPVLPFSAPNKERQSFLQGQCRRLDPYFASIRCSVGYVMTGGVHSRLRLLDTVGLIQKAK